MLRVRDEHVAGSHEMSPRPYPNWGLGDNLFCPSPLDRREVDKTEASLLLSLASGFALGLVWFSQGADLVFPVWDTKDT